MINVGFIGFGRMGLTHFSILNTNPDVRIVAVCDQSATMLKIFNKYVDVRTFSDYGVMLDTLSLDSVIVSTPGDSHAEIIKECLKKGLHVFVEKPFTISVSEGMEAIRELAGKPLINQVGYVNRFNEVFSEVRDLLNRGLIGDVRNFSSEMYGPTVLKDPGDGWRGKRDTGGGCMYEFASHCIDLVVFLFGAPDRVAGSITQSIYSSSVEDFVSSTFLYDDGLVGSIVVNWSDETYRKPTNIVTIFGTKGKIRADKHAYKVFLKDDEPSLGLRRGWNSRYITDMPKSVRFYVRGNEFTHQLDHFIDCIKAGTRENMCCFAEAIKTDILMEKVFEDARTAFYGRLQTSREAREHQSADIFYPKRFFPSLAARLRRLASGFLMGIRSKLKNS